jgi:hypothetical protein
MERLILIWILKKYNVKVWTGFVWLRIGWWAVVTTVYENLGSIKGGKVFTS